MKKTLHPVFPVMLVDDEELILDMFDTFLREAGITNIIICSDSREVMPLASKQEIEVMLLDLTMPYISGDRLLQNVNQDFPEIPVIVVTGTNDVKTAVECMKIGAYDYIVKPVEEDLLAACVKRAIKFRELNREVNLLKQRVLSDKIEHPEAFSSIITNSDCMRPIFQYVEAVAKTANPVLITGETGVGKELIAKAIHVISGRSGLFVPINVSGLDDNIFSDTLFGHRKGAFTGADETRGGLIEQASGGTLFLDEIGDLGLTSQVKLLRLLEEREYLPLGYDVPRHTDARIVAATNRDLHTVQEEGRFRNDLYYRLCAHHIHIPPLRERMNDLPLLIDHFLTEASQELGKKKPTPPKELFDILGAYSFPGNIRELRAMVFDAVSAHNARVLSTQLFRYRIHKGPRWPKTQGSVQSGRATNIFSTCVELPTLKQSDRLLMDEAIKRANGNLTIASELLGISRQALSKRLKRASDPDQIPARGAQLLSR